MTHFQLILAETKAREDGNEDLANKLQAERWARATGMIVNSENTKKPHKR